MRKEAKLEAISVLREARIMIRTLADGDRSDSITLKQYNDQLAGLEDLQRIMEKETKSD